MLEQTKYLENFKFIENKNAKFYKTVANKENILKNKENLNGDIQTIRINLRSKLKSDLKEHFGILFTKT